MPCEKSPKRPPRALLRWVGVGLAVALAGTARAQSFDAPPMERRPVTPIERAVEQMFRAVPEMRERWSEHTIYGLNAIDNVFASQGWDSEPDQFALSIAKASAQLPPWDVQGRYDLIVGKLSDRYMLDAAQEDALREMIVRESNEFIGRNMGRMLPMMTEAARLRLAGEPFTPEIVQRWSQEIAPLFYEARERFKTRSAEFLEILDPDQRAIVEEDLGAAFRRMDRMEQLGAEWNDGRWRPEDWGIGQDPIQRGDMRAAAGDATVAEGAVPGTGAASGQPRQASAGDSAMAWANPTSQPVESPARVGGGASDPWADYVRQFISKYGLDDGQQQRAWVIYKNAVERREQQARRFEARSGRVNGPAAQARLAESRAASEKTIFEELKRRLDRLPTTAQRRAAGSTGAP